MTPSITDITANIPMNSVVLSVVVSVVVGIGIVSRYHCRREKP